MTAPQHPAASSAAAHPGGGAAAFWNYFNAADELDGGLTLEELDRRFVRSARDAAAALGLPWPPYLAAAEDYALDNPEFVRGEVGW